MNPIDFVMIWVDGNDPKWRKSFNAHKYGEGIEQQQPSTHMCRFRDWNNLHYWFRSVEKYCPWVNKIHIVTCGHFPHFLNKQHPKVNIVHHADIIDPEYLPTFSSHVIEINIHKIKGLSERFVYFNDDMFINKPLEPEFFFKNNLPRDGILLEPITAVDTDNLLAHVMLTNISIINRNFNFKALCKNKRKYFFNIRYGLSANKRNLLYSYHLIFSSIFNHHLPQPFLKQTFNEVWEKEQDYLEKVCRHRFREYDDVNQYMFRIWQLCQGNFFPTKIQKRGKAYRVMTDNLPKIQQTLIENKLPLICLNDHEAIQDSQFESLKHEIYSSFHQKLPEKCSFEN